jgi:hypothetical protein
MDPRNPKQKKIPPNKHVEVLLEQLQRAQDVNQMQGKIIQEQKIKLRDLGDTNRALVRLINSQRL